MSSVEKSKLIDAGGMILAVGSLMGAICFYPAVTICHWIGFRILGFGMCDNAFTFLGYCVAFGGVLGLLWAIWETFVETKIKTLLVILVIIYIITLPTFVDIISTPDDGSSPDISLEKLFWGWIWSYLSIWWVYSTLFGIVVYIILKIREKR